MYLRRALTTSLKFLRLYRLLLSCLIAAAAGPAEAGSSSQPINSPREIGGRIAGRWTPPRTVEMLEVTVRLSFSRTGAVIGEPRVTYIKAPDEGGLKENKNQRSCRNQSLHALAVYTFARGRNCRAHALDPYPFAASFRPATPYLTLMIERVRP